jgi:hypothetical protein
MSVYEESEDEDAWREVEDPFIIAAIGAELERIAGEDRPHGSSPSDLWFLPLASMDELLVLLREMPSGIGVAEFASRLRARFGNLSTLKAIFPESEAEDGA